MKVKSMVATVILTAMAVVSVSGLGASANNHGDVGFAFTVGGNNIHYLTQRVKEDTTPIYMKCNNSSGGSYEARAYGASDGGTTVYQDCSYRPSNHEVFIYYLAGGSVYKMRNWVKEQNLSYATIQTRSNGGGNVNADGVWSPDSV